MQGGKSASALSKEGVDAAQAVRRQIRDANGLGRERVGHAAAHLGQADALHEEGHSRGHISGEGGVVSSQAGKIVVVHVARAVDDHVARIDGVAAVLARNGKEPTE